MWTNLAEPWVSRIREKTKWLSLPGVNGKNYCSVNSNDFKVKYILGSGSFSKVKLVKHRKSGKLYAMKVMEKSKIKRSGVIESIMLEKSILENLECPFISNLRYAFQDAKNLFMVLDYLPGGDLRQNMRNHKYVEDEIKHIFCEVACGIEYIHQNNIIHRDIKPENVMFDMKGHAYIIDFNVSAFYSDGEDTNGTFGSSNYMAPELLSGKSYDKSVDWWSLGVVSYELAFDKRPFYGTNNRELLASINKGIDFDKVKNETSIEISKKFENFLLFMLTPDKRFRLGAGNEMKGMSNIIKANWITDQDWGLFVDRKTVSPYVPLPYPKSSNKEKLSLIEKISAYGLVSTRNSSENADKTKCSYEIKVDPCQGKYLCARDVLLHDKYYKWNDDVFKGFTPYDYYYKMSGVSHGPT